MGSFASASGGDSGVVVDSNFCSSSEAPQDVQNLLPGGNSAPHFVQNIFLPPYSKERSIFLGPY